VVVLPVLPWDHVAFGSARLESLFLCREPFI